MKKRRFITRTILTVCIAVCLLFISVTPLKAFQWYGYYWDSDCTYYDASSLPDDWIWAIYLAATEWNSAGADFRILPSSSSDNDITRGYYGSESWLAETTVYHSGYVIYEADTIFNTRYSWYTDGNDYKVQHTATHELGHFLMLQHTYTNNAIMYFYYNGLLELHEDDIEGIIYIYGEE